MATTVFGTPITDETLKGMPEYHDKDITQKDRARVALNMKHAEGKDINARNYLDNLKERYEKEMEKKVSTRCLIYNATGAPMTFGKANHYDGSIYESPFPVIIENGQWGVFLHGEHFKGSGKSGAGVWYTGKNSAGDFKHWFAYWRTNAKASGKSNQVFTSVDNNLPGKNSDENDQIQNDINNRLSSDQDQLVDQDNINGGLVFGSIGNVENPLAEFTMTLPEAMNY